MDNKELMEKVDAFMKSHPESFPPEKHESIKDHITSALDKVAEGASGILEVPLMAVLCLSCLVSGRPLFGD